MYFCFTNQEPTEWCKHLTWPQTILWALRTEHRTSWEEVTVTDRVAEQTARELKPAVCVVCSKALITYHCDRDHWLAPDSAGRQPSLTTPSEQCRSVGWGHCSERPWHQSPQQASLVMTTVVATIGLWTPKSLRRTMLSLDLSLSLAFSMWSENSIHSSTLTCGKFH